MAASPVTVGDHYSRSRIRLTELLATIDVESWERPVVACPGWRVRDVVAHLFGNTEDALAGRLTGPPLPEQTAEQVARHLDDDPVEMLQAWNQAADSFEEVITQLEAWPAAIDVITHEHDIRAALDRPEGRDDESVRFFAAMLLERLELPVPLTVVADGETLLGPPAGEALLTLETTAFEILRFRLGRRTRGQVEALRWSGDPTPVLDHLFVFGPAAHSISE